MNWATIRRLAIAQLAESWDRQGHLRTTTYSPGASVTRGQMALFISRLMNLMDPLTDGDDDDGDDAHTPSDVVDNDLDKDIGTPFSDLRSTTKTAYHAITQLYELGVASGISNTAYEYVGFDYSSFVWPSSWLRCWITPTPVPLV